MKNFAMAWLVGLLACTSVGLMAQQTANVRGTITAFDGTTVSVKTRSGDSVDVAVPDNTPVSGTKAIALADIKPGATLGVTTIRRADGAVVAIDVRPIPAAARLGLSPYDLQPGATMTNATLEGQVESSSGGEITLNYKDGSVKVIVPPGTPMSQAIPGNRSDIKPGETIYIAARVGSDGKLTAARVQVSTNGVKPTQ